MFFVRRGHHTGTAYSRIGLRLTSDLYNVEKTCRFDVPTVLLIIPNTLFALLTVIPICLFQDKSLDTFTPKLVV